MLSVERKSQYISKHGNVMIITIFALFLITTLAVAMLSITTDTLYMNNRQQYRANALNIAESGAEEGALWLVQQTTPPYGSATIRTCGPISMNGGTYTYKIDPDTNNNNNFLKIYKITSAGTYKNLTQTVEVVVQQASFGKYAYFTDSEVSSVSGGTIWWTSRDLIDGPVHSNNTNNSNFSINYSGSTSPIFLDTVTSSGNTINYSPSRPRSESTFKTIFKNGSTGYKLGVDPIALPNSSDAQKNAAWGDTSGFPTSTGTYLSGNSSSGIYIVGDASIQLALDSSGNQQVLITQTINSVLKTTTVTMDKSTSTTTVNGTVGNGSVTSESSLTNGVIYCTGNITSLKGVVADNLVSDGKITERSALTVATDVNNKKDITITDNLVYNTKPDKTQDDSAAVNLAAGTLGIVSHNIIVSSYAPTNLEIDGILMAGGQNTSDGSFYVKNYSTKYPTGKLTVLGGIIQKQRGPVGTFDSYSGSTSSGYSKNYHYDTRLGKNPPPYYPTTGQYDRISWRVLPSN